MSTHRQIDRICCAILALTLLVTVLFINGDSFGLQRASAVMGYESRLFDTSAVHTIDIVMDDWDEFIANCKSEEYYSCTIVIDGQASKNVAIRGKGNTSLSQVDSYGNDRYSFKVEFDHYDSSNTYYGLDKLCLNNIIQDNTYLKDYLTYQLMRDMGVAAPLCSFAYITVNGEDWGLYLAVEGVEEAFLQRNYGRDYGDLYKPDSMSMGGGRGNGKGFDMDDFMADFDMEEFTGKMQNGSQDMPDMPDMPNMPDMPDMPGMGSMSQDITPPDGMEMPTDMDAAEGAAQPERPEAGNEAAPQQEPDGDKKQGEHSRGGFGGMSMGSDDVLLRYTDDDFDSYSNIFDNAKTAVTDGDKTRLIQSLKKLTAMEDIEAVVDVETVIRYFVVHNFVLNFDSYTGSMIHNYYLYEKDGQLQMIPWDYNLAFGGFQSMSDAESLVNYPIDSPVSGGSAEDRPMIAWIFQNEEYTELYHEIFSEFIGEYFESGYFEEMLDGVIDLISPYVEKDPTKFCTYEEFLTGSATLREFCLLRAESIRGQLDGTIGSTDDTQQPDTLIDAGDISTSDMGGFSGGGHSAPGGDMHTSFDGDQGRREGRENTSSGQHEDRGGNDSPDGGMARPTGGDRQNAGADISGWIWLGASALVLLCGVTIALCYRRR